MSFQHDPLRQVSYLQQCLSQDKKKLGLFLGAGCPMAIRVKSSGVDLPLIPDIAGITKEVRSRLVASKDHKDHFKLIEEHFKKDKRHDASVEDMLSHIRALRIVAGKDVVRGLTAENLDKLDAEICTVINDLANKTLPDGKTPYHRVAAWIDAAVREMPVEIFTTNYDLLMEQAFEDLHVPYFDGFAGACKPFFDLRTMEENKLPQRWARLWKLHGSINWYQNASKGVFRGAANEQGAKRVIHPSHLKYDESRRMPYLAMIDRLRAFLKHPSVALFLCGYSFRDNHINEVIVQGLQGNPTGIAFALLFDKLETYQKAMKLAIERSNLSLLAKDAVIIGTRRASWMEKDPVSVPTTGGHWVKWDAADPKDEKSKRKAEFCLGNFAVFCAFLHELIGEVPQKPEELNAK